MSLLGSTKGINNGNTTILTHPTAAALHRDVRKAAVSALILKRNKGTVAPLDLLRLFFSVMATLPNKALRDLLCRHMVNDIHNINQKGKRDDNVNRTVQSFLQRIYRVKAPTMRWLPPKSVPSTWFVSCTDVASATVPDKALRDFLYRHMVNDIGNRNQKGKRDDTVNRSV
jgi:hypothetical protein